MRYVIVRLSSDILVLRAHAEPTSHSAVTSLLLEELERAGLPTETIDFEVEGGGKLSIDHDRRRINAYGESLEFGPASPEAVTNLLREYADVHFAGYSVSVACGPD